jgi:DNA-directed RNA polymerase subunit RPC12/RpoP
MTIKTYTHTAEGQQVLGYLENIISTHGMEVYKCDTCEELFGGRPEEAKNDNGYPECGVCSYERKAINRAENPMEYLED